MWQAAVWRSLPVAASNGFLALHTGFGERTAGVEAAAGRRIDRVRRIAGDRRLLGAMVGIERRHRGKQRARIGMARVLEQHLDRRRLDHLAEIHDDHAIADEAHHVEVVRDEHVSQAETRP